MDKTGVLLELAERVAKQNYSGHLTILRFTTHWKVCFGTPNLDAGARDEVGNLSDYESLGDALFHLLYDSISCEDCCSLRKWNHGLKQTRTAAGVWFVIIPAMDMTERLSRRRKIWMLSANRSPWFVCRLMAWWKEEWSTNEKCNDNNKIPHGGQNH